MTERRRPLENDDGQGALFGGEAFAPSGPAPAWKRPTRPDASADAPPLEAGVDAEAQALSDQVAGAARGFEPGAPQPADADLDAPHAFEPGAPQPADADPDAPHAFEPGAPQPVDAALDAPHAFEPGAPQPVDAALDAPHAFESQPAAARALDPGTAEPESRSPFADEIAELERATEDHAPRRPRAPLAGPTLDDVMSRVWEGLATGLPAACPVCHGEVVPAISGPPQGRCSSCGTTID